MSTVTAGEIAVMVDNKDGEKSVNVQELRKQYSSNYIIIKRLYPKYPVKVSFGSAKLWDTSSNTFIINKESENKFQFRARCIRLVRKEKEAIWYLIP